MIIPEHRRSPPSFFEKNLGTTVLLVNDLWQISKLLKDHGFPSLDVKLEDGSGRFETLARIAEGSVMGLVVGLRGPGATIWSKQKEKRKSKQAQSMKLVHSQQCLLELVETVDSSRGFVIFVGSCMNKAWEFHNLQTLLKNPR